MDLGRPKSLLLALSSFADRDRSSGTTPRGRSSYRAGKCEEAFRSPSSPEEDPPKTNSVETGYDSDYNL